MAQKNDTINIIRKFLNERGWSVYRLAKESDIPYSSLNNIFIRNTEPTIPTLRRICSGLSISMSEFFAEDNTVDTSSRPQTLITQSDEEIEIIELFRKLNKKDAEIFIAYTKGFAHVPLGNLDNE